jgi:hypothetical protein
MSLATGSPTVTKTIGIVRVSRWTAMVATFELVRMMSGCKPTNSCARAPIRLLSPPAQRMSKRTLRPSVQPKSASARVNAEMRGFDMGSFSSPGMSTPIRRTRSVCCARTTIGHAAALATPAMNCRRRIVDPSRWSGGRSVTGRRPQGNGSLWRPMFAAVWPWPEAAIRILILRLLSGAPPTARGPMPACWRCSASRALGHHRVAGKARPERCIPRLWRTRRGSRPAASSVNQGSGRGPLTVSAVNETTVSQIGARPCRFRPPAPVTCRGSRAPRQSTGEAQASRRCLWHQSNTGSICDRRSPLARRRHQIWLPRTESPLRPRSRARCWYRITSSSARQGAG